MKFIFVVIVGFYFFCPVIYAEPTTNKLKIIEIRPYNSAGKNANVYITTDTKGLCNTNVYKIDLSWNGSKEVLSVALAAFMADKPVKIEIDNAGCSGWGSRIQSIYLIK